VLPRPHVAEALVAQVTRQILVTDCGYFPAAEGHRRSRPHGAGQVIVIVCTEGRGWCRMRSVQHVVKAGTALVIPADEPHVYGSDDADPWTVWWVHVAGDAVDELVAAAGTSALRPVVGVPQLARAVSLVDDTIRALEKDESPASLIAASGAAWHLLSLLASGRHSPDNGRPDPVALATAILQQNLDSSISVTELADSVGLSPSHLTALFREALGCPPGRYLTRLRMSVARELLDTTDMPVASIARHVGYDDPYYFARQFRSVHGMSATHYRSGAKG
jgi:AraC family transcriptional regulator of arabinose operon